MGRDRGDEGEGEREDRKSRGQREAERGRIL